MFVCHFKSTLQIFASSPVWFYFCILCVSRYTWCCNIAHQHAHKHIYALNIQVHTHTHTSWPTSYTNVQRACTGRSQACFACKHFYICGLKNKTSSSILLLLSMTKFVHITSLSLLASTKHTRKNTRLQIHYTWAECLHDYIQRSIWVA